MDHKRIEWLFLIVFLLIDLYLGVEILRSPVSLSGNNSEATGVTDMRSEMHADGIDLPSKVSEEPSSGYYLAGKDHDDLSKKVATLTNVDANYNKKDNNLNAAPKSAVFINGKEHEKLSQLNAFKNNPRNVAYGKQYIYEANMSSSNSFTFVQQSAYGNIYDSSGQLTINVKNGQITNYSQTYISDVSPVRELQSTISPWHALRAMYTNRELADNSRVVKIKLGYSELTVVRGSRIFLPTWLVWVENKTTKNISLKRVNAYTGQILQTNASYNIEK